MAIRETLKSEWEEYLSSMNNIFELLCTSVQHLSEIDQSAVQEYYAKYTEQIPAEEKLSKIDIDCLQILCLTALKAGSERRREQRGKQR